MEPKTRIAFTGDISFSGFFHNGWKNDACLSAEITSYLQDADYVVANIEGPLTDGVFLVQSSLLHSSSPVAGAFLKKNNIRIWNLANNHVMDCGKVGLEDTISTAKQNECQVIGAGMNLSEASKTLIVGDSVKIGLLSVSKPWKHVISDQDVPGAFTWNRTVMIREQIQELKKSADWVVVIVHGGDELTDLALPYVRKKYRSFLQQGADIVIGHHPHVVQDYEIIGDKYIFYSLGNFVFDTEHQRAFSHTDNGILLRIHFAKTSFSFDHLPTHINRDLQTVEAGDTNPVFCSVGDDYKKIWPLSARYFYKVDLKKRKRTSERIANASAIWIFLHDVYSLRRSKEREVLLGRLLSLFGKWKDSDKIEVINYLHR